MLKVGVISTGDELVEMGGAARDGQIYDANRPMLLQLAADFETATGLNVATAQTSHHHSEWWDSGQAIEVPAGQGPPVGVPPAVSAAGAAASAAGSAARKLGAWARGDV